MLIITLFIIISIVYLYKTSYMLIPTQNKFAFILMILYIFLYFSVPQIEAYNVVHRYTYIFAYFPLVSYTIILFPNAFFVPTKDLFPELSEHLAVKATKVVAWVGFVLMFVLLLGLKYFYHSN